MVDNTNVDRSMAYVHQTVFEYLYYREHHSQDRVSTRPFSPLHSIFDEVCSTCLEISSCLFSCFEKMSRHLHAFFDLTACPVHSRICLFVYFVHHTMLNAQFTKVSYTAHLSSLGDAVTGTRFESHAGSYTSEADD
jgi:hypothetical protein